MTFPLVQRFPARLCLYYHKHNTGWTTGGGIAGSVPNNARLTSKVEYLHVDLGSVNFSFDAPASGVVAVTSRSTDNIVRVSADYHF
jgi:opacity protein-like surface antigen